MASYNGLTENIDPTKFDNEKILRDLEKLESTLTVLKSYPTEELSDEVKSKIHTTVTSFEVLQSRIFKSTCSSKILDRLWEGQPMMKYLFGDCIQYIDQMNILKCSVCNHAIQATRDDLKLHIENKSHIHKYSESTWSNKVTFWREMSYSLYHANAIHIDDDECLILKYGKFVDFEGPNDMLFCKVCCKKIPKDKTKLLEHFKETLHQKRFEEIVNVITGSSTKINTEKSKEKNIFVDEESSSSVKLNFNNIQSAMTMNNDTPAEPSTATSPQSTIDKKLGKWLDDVVSQFIIQLLETESSSTRLYICTLCLFNTMSLSKWKNHCRNTEHKMIAEPRTRFKPWTTIYLPCECFIQMICNKACIVKYHLAEHHEKILATYDNIKKLEQRKLNNPTSSCKDTSLSENDSDDNNNNNDDDDDDDSDENSNKNVNNRNSGIFKTIGAESRMKESDETKVQKKETRKNGPIGLSGIPEGTTDGSLIRATMHFGSVKEIQRVSSTTANLYIDLSDVYKNILDLDLKVRINGADVKITGPFNHPSDRSDESRVPRSDESRVPRSDESLVPISMKRAFRMSFALDFWIKALVSRAKDVAVFSKLDESRFESRSIIENISTEIRKLSYDVAAVGSRALKIAISSDATLDLFVGIGDTYCGEKKEPTPLALSSRTAKIFKDLKMKNSPAIKNLVVVGDQEQYIQFQYVYSDSVKCRLFCIDGLVVEKTKLSRIYLNCDEKIYQMVLFLIEWFNVVGIKDVLPSYSILWLALFSLMVGPSPILHPVVILRGKNQDGRLFISGWDCRYSETFSPLIEETPVNHMLLRFFQLYSNVQNFNKLVLAPLTGEKFPHKRFLERKLPPPYGKYIHLIKDNNVRFFKLTKGLCLQDPLQLNYNLTTKMQGDKLAKFVRCCQESLESFGS